MDSFRGVWSRNGAVSGRREPAADPVTSPELPPQKGAALTAQTARGETAQGGCGRRHTAQRIQRRIVYCFNDDMFLYRYYSFMNNLTSNGGMLSERTLHLSFERCLLRWDTPPYFKAIAYTFLKLYFGGV